MPSNYNGLQIAEKKFDGITIGYVVGWWRRASRYSWYGDTAPRPPLKFASVRGGVIFKDRADAVTFRDSIEDRIAKDTGITWSE